MPGVGLGVQTTQVRTWNHNTALQPLNSAACVRTYKDRPYRLRLSNSIVFFGSCNLTCAVPTGKQQVQLSAPCIINLCRSVASAQTRSEVASLFYRGTAWMLKIHQALIITLLTFHRPAQHLPRPPQHLPGTSPAPWYKHCVKPSSARFKRHRKGANGNKTLSCLRWFCQHSLHLACTYIIKAQRQASLHTITHSESCTSLQHHVTTACSRMYRSVSAIYAAPTKRSQPCCSQQLQVLREYRVLVAIPQAIQPH